MRILWTFWLGIVSRGREEKMAGREEEGGGRIYGAFAEVFLGLVVGHFCGLAASWRD